jgi:phosphoglycolate phosphatase
MLRRLGIALAFKGSAMKPRIRLLITDLDNTLYDWVTYFAESFHAMVVVAAPLLEVSEKTLLDELREVHRRYHNTEHPFALLETPAVRERFASLTRDEQAHMCHPAFAAFNAARDRTLTLYPGVAETLRAVRAAGVPVVGHTEATVANARFRLRRLGIAPLFDRLYASANEGEGPPGTREPRAAAPVPPTRHLAAGERKPDPAVLRDICQDFAVNPADTLYVGDSTARDIAMAVAAGAHSAWAAYGTRVPPELWRRVVRVSHWTEEDVRRARAAERRAVAVHPDVTLDQGLADILDHFLFADAATEPARVDTASNAKRASAPRGSRVPVSDA